MVKRPLFILVFADNSIFQGGDYNKTKWNEIPQNKKIKRIFYSLPNGSDCLCLDGYDTYFNMIECTTDLNGIDSGKVKIEFAYIMGKKEDKIICYKIALSYTANHRLGDIQKIEYLESDEFIQKLNINGWK